MENVSIQPLITHLTHHKPEVHMDELENMRVLGDTRGGLVTWFTVLLKYNNLAKTVKCNVNIEQFGNLLECPK